MGPLLSLVFDCCWNVPKEQIPVPKLYSNVVTNPDYEHGKVCVDFAVRTNQCREPCAWKGLYKHDPTRVDKLQQTIVEQRKDTQDRFAASRAHAKALAKRTQRAKAAAEALKEDIGHVLFDGSVNKCAICMDNFLQKDSVCRLLCRHVFHEKCLQVFMANTDAKKASCPECRGTIRDPKHYLYIAENQFQNSDSSDDDAHRGKAYNTPARNPTNQVNRDRRSNYPPSGSSLLGSSTVTVQPLFPMWQMHEPMEEKHFASMETPCCLVGD
jgi:hypothetical protein